MKDDTYDLRSLREFDAFSDDDVRAISEGKGSVSVSGYAARFNELSDDLGGFRETMTPGCFDDVLKDKSTDVRMLVNHTGVPLARFRGARDDNTLSLEIDGSGLRYSFRMDVSDPANRALAVAMKRGDIDQSSFRFRAIDGSKFIERDGGMVREVFRVTSLRDTSIVTFPAYPTTSAEVKRSLDEAQADATPTEFDTKPNAAKADAARAEAEACNSI